MNTYAFDLSGAPRAAVAVNTDGAGLLRGSMEAGRLLPFPAQSSTQSACTFAMGMGAYAGPSHGS